MLSFKMYTPPSHIYCVLEIAHVALLHNMAVSKSVCSDSIFPHCGGTVFSNIVLLRNSTR